MAKYRVVALPKAQKGLSKRKKDKQSTAPGQGAEAIYPMTSQEYGNVTSPFGTPEEQAYLAQSQQEDAAYQEMLDKMDASRRGRFDEANELLSKFNTQNTIQDLSYRAERFAKSKKYDKIEPFREIPMADYNPDMKQNMIDSGFLPYENKKKGVVELYPKNEIATRIINNGLRTNEIVKKLGIADEKTIKAEFGDLMKAADEQYGATITSKVLDEVIKKGISPEEAMSKLPKSYGTTEGLKNKYLKQTNQVLEDALKNVSDEMGNSPLAAEEYGWLFNTSSDPESDFNKAYYKKADGSPDWDKINARSERIKQAKKEANTFNRPVNIERNTYDTQASDQFSNYQNYYDQILNTKNKQARDSYIETTAAAEPFQEALSKYIAPDVQSVYTQKLNQKADKVLKSKDYTQMAEMLHNFSPSGRMDDVFTTEERDNLNSSISGIAEKKLSLPSFQNRGYNAPVTALDKIQDMATYPAYFMQPGDQSNVWDNERTLRDQREIEKQTGQDIYGDIEGSAGLEALNTWNPLRLGYESRKNIEAGRYGDLLTDIASFVAPQGKAFSKGLFNAGKKILTNKPLQAGLTGLGYYNALNPEGSFAKAYDAFSDYRADEGLENLGWGLLEMSPIVGDLKGARSLSKAFTSPGNVVQFPSKSKYTASYLTPSNSVISAGNTSLRDVSPVFENITNPINRFLKPMNMGQVKILKQNPALLNKGQSILGYQTGGLYKNNLPKAQLGPIIKYGKSAYNALGDLTSSLGKVLTTATPLKNAYKINPSVTNFDINLKDLTKAQEFASQYGYELPLNLERIAESDMLTDRAIRGLMDRHNTFVRGISTNWDEIEKRNPEILRHLEGKGIDWQNNAKAAAEYMATHVPISTGYGRSSLNSNVFNQGLQGLYTSNSIPTAEGYTYGKGFITKVKRPTDFSSPSRQDWITKNDPKYYENFLPGGNSFIINGKEVSPIDLNLSSLYDVIDYDNIDAFKSKVLKDLEESAKNLKSTFERTATSNPVYSQNMRDSYNRVMKKINEIKNQKWESSSLELNKKLLRTERDIEDMLNPYAHYIHLGIPGEKVLQPIKSWEITPEIWKNKSRAHTNKYSKKLSRLEEGGLIELELTPEEIDKYKKRGYIVEEID